MELLCEKRYLVLPVSEQASPKRLEIYCGGKLALDLCVRLAGARYDYLYYYDMRNFLGKTVSFSTVPEIELSLTLSDFPAQSGPEKYRPLVRFTANRGWINDPNGLVWYEGQYHLFYQLNPVGCRWGNMHWGHAVSGDLMHWEEREIALFPDETGTMFSGSAIVDTDNLLGVREGAHDTIVLFYTAAGDTSALSRGREFTQCVAYSTDGGETFVKYPGNPVLPCAAKENRDPKVIYHPQTGQYIMALYLIENRFALYSSKNLTDWALLQELEIEGETECPDFYPLPLDGDEENVKWVLIGASDRYVAGAFDGRRFVPETKVERLQHGGECYAAQSWSNAPGGRRIRVGWLRRDIPGMPFNHAMTVPCELTLKTAEGGMALAVNPVDELSLLHKGTKRYGTLTVEHTASVPLDGPAQDIRMRISHGESARVWVRLLGTELVLDAGKRLVTCNGIPAPLRAPGGTTGLRIVSDVTGVEVFINGGTGYIVSGHIADETLNRLAFETQERVLVQGLAISSLAGARKEEGR